MQEREYSIKKKVKWKSEENTKLINFYNKKYKNLINNKELNNNYNIEYTKLNKYNKIVYDTIKNIFLYHNYNIIYNNLYNNSYYIISKYINSNKYRNFYKYQNNFIKIFKIKLKLKNIFIKKISTYYKSRHVDVIVDYSDLLKLIKDDKCVPFWNDKIKNISQKIFLPTSDNLIKIKNKKEFKTFNYKNWFETAHYKGLNVLEDIKIDKERFYNGNSIKCRQIKIYFNKEQKIVINNMFGYYRYYYNRAIQYINNYNKKTQKTYYLIDPKNESSKVNINLSNIQNKFTAITMRNYLKNNKPEWIIQMPSHLIDKAFKEAENSYNNNMKKYMKYHKSFKLKFKTKKDKTQTMNIEKQMFGKNNNIFPQIKYNNNLIFKKIKYNETFKKFNYTDSSITCDTKLNEYYLNLNYKCHKNINLKNVKNLKKNKKKILGKEKVCSIDPGIRCFLTIYSDNGVSEIGLNITEKINKVCKEINIIKSKINKKINNKFKYNKRKRKSLNKALHRKIKYVTNIKTELHNKSIKYLTDNYAKIILPHFEIQKMCNIKNKFNNKLAKNLYNISFYKFKMKLVNKCIENDIELVMCQEYYTSKTCTRCGNIKHDLGCNKIYKCEKCNIIIDRDISAARNIMLRNNNF